MTRARYLLAPWVVAVALSGACTEDDCPEAASECEGNIRRECRMERRGSGHPGPSTTSRVWISTDCGERVCVVATKPDGKPAALCALYKEPRPCPERDTAGAVCQGKDLVSCSYGYATETKSCPREDLCHATFPVGCLARAGIDPGCVAARPAITYCDGGHLVTCSGDGYATEEKDCGAPERCHTFTFSTPEASASPKGSATCRLSTERDPRCTTPPLKTIVPGFPSVEACAGDQSLYCVDGYLVEERPCKGCRIVNSALLRCDP